MLNFDDLKLAVEALSGGRNTVVFDTVAQNGIFYPNIMVRIPMFPGNAVLPGASSDPHPMFIIGGQTVPEILVSKYQNVMVANRAYSLPFRAPATGVTFDVAKMFCENKGSGWHLTTNAEYAGLALWCLQEGVPLRGHTGGGGNNIMPHERGTLMGEYTATGSGPASWYHDGTLFGISDLVGNAWEWAAGLRLKNGEIQIIPDNDAALAVDQGANSSVWKALSPAGIPYLPGAANSIKFDATVAGGSTMVETDLGGGVILRTSRDNPNFTGGDVNANYQFQSVLFDKITADSEVAQAMNKLKLLGLMPAPNSLDGKLFIRNYGERMALRGGACDGSAGLFALNLMHGRASAAAHRGFRAAYVKL